MLIEIVVILVVIIVIVLVRVEIIICIVRAVVNIGRIVIGDVVYGVVVDDRVVAAPSANAETSVSCLFRKILVELSFFSEIKIELTYRSSEHPSRSHNPNYYDLRRKRKIVRIIFSN